MNISVEQLEDILNQQKQECRRHFVEIWDKSEFKKDLIELDKKKILENRIYEIRDGMIGADFPEEFKIIKKYSL